MNRLALGVLSSLLISAGSALPAVARSAIHVLSVMKPTMAIGSPHTGEVAVDRTHNVLYVTGSYLNSGVGSVSTINVLNASTGAREASLSMPGVDPQALAYDARRGQIVVLADHRTIPGSKPQSAPDMIYVLSRAPLRVLTSISLGTTSSSVVSTADDVVLYSSTRTAYVLTGSGAVLSVALTTGTVRTLATLAQDADSVMAGSLTIDHRAARLIAVWGANVALYDLSTGREMRRLLGTGAEQVALDSTRGLIAVPDSHTGVDLLNEQTGATVRVVNTLREGLVPVSSITVDPTDGTITTVAEVPTKTNTNTCCQELVTIDETTGAVLAHHPVIGDVQTLSADGSHVFAESYPSNVLTMASARTGAIAGAYRFYATTYSGYPAGFVLDPASHRVFIVGWGKQWVIDSAASG